MSRSGFVALAGRPNVGKSTFVNAVVGEKVAIVSDRPQTTRRAIRGVYQSGESQIVLVDLPGVQRPRDALTSRMAKRVQQELEGSDAALLMLNGEQGVGPGDRFIAKTLADAPRPGDGRGQQGRQARPRPARRGAAARLGARSRRGGLPDLGSSRHRYGGAGRLSRGPHARGQFMFAAGSSSDQSEDVLFAELIREAVIRRTFQEIPTPPR